MAIMYRAQAAAVALALLAHPLAVAAEDPANCFELAASKINRGSIITIVDPDSQRTTGRLQFVDVREKLLVLGNVRPIGEDARSYRLDEISRIEYRSVNSNPGWLAKGFVFGTYLGMAAFNTAALLSQDENESVGLATLAGGLIGGALGLVIGPIIGASSTTRQTIECPPGMTSEAR